MEGIESFHTYLKSLSHQAGMLAEAVVALSESFEAEAARLTREDGVRNLKAIHAAVVAELERSRQMEDAASNNNRRAILPFEFVGLAAKIIVAATIENRRARNFVNQVFDTSAGKKLPYGTVMACVGPKGLPDDVRVVSISGLARESNQQESAITEKLQKGGCLLFSQDTFSCLIDKLVIDVREGRLHLPIPIETLKGAETLRLEAKRAVWVRLPRPQ